MERTKLLGNPEDPERTPDVPEDPEHTPFACNAQSRGSDADHAMRLGRRLQNLWWCSAGLLVALVILLVTMIFRETSMGKHLQVPWSRSRGNERSGSFAGSGSVLAPPVSAGNNPGGICNASAQPALLEPLRQWRLSPVWRRVCEAKNHKSMLPFERNWCWIGVKNKCHANLKAHHSWTELQGLASKEGIAPPIRDETFHPLAAPEVCDRPWFGRARPFTLAENQTARRWLKEHVATYVLNLPSDRERWAMISRRLQALEIWATRVSGVDMRIPGALTVAKRMGWVPQIFNFTRAQANAYSPVHQMGSILGTLGCASAHFKVQQRILADGSPLGLVLEDDSWPEEDFITRLWSLVNEELPCDWEVVALMSRCPYGRCVSPHLARVQPDGNEPAWRCRQGVNWGMHAILYRTQTLRKVQELWKRTVFDEARPHCMDVDVALASISDKVGFYAVPAVQDPGFLKETNHPSARWSINQAAITTSTQTTTSFIFVPTLPPGEPWPGAWKFG